MANINPYRPVEAVVLDVFPETPTITTVRFKTKGPMSFATGQFIEMTIPGAGEAPFTPSSRPSNKEIMEVTVMRVGKVTQKIHELKKGDTIGIRGPLGNGYPMEKFQGKEILIVGGGCGFAPLRSLMYEFFDRSGQFKKLFFRGGCKTNKELLYQHEMQSWGTHHELDMKLTVDTADETWKGNVGLVTTLLDDIPIEHEQGIAIVCGPPIMMKFTTFKLVDLGFKEHNIYLSMEKNMSCGIGKCGHCRLGIYYGCKDGPVFTYDKIKNFHHIWE